MSVGIDVPSPGVGIFLDCHPGREVPFAMPGKVVRVILQEGDEVLEEQDHIRNLIREYTRHLRHLEIQKAQMGLRSDAGLLVSIDDTRNEISNLRKKDDLLDELLDKYIIFESCQN